MRQSLRNRIARLEDTARQRRRGKSRLILSKIGGGRVVGHIPARLIETGQPFDYRTSIAELGRAIGDGDAEHA